MGSGGTEDAGAGDRTSRQKQAVSKRTRHRIRKIRLSRQNHSVYTLPRTQVARLVKAIFMQLKIYDPSRRRDDEKNYRISPHTIDELNRILALVCINRLQQAYIITVSDNRKRLMQRDYMAAARIANGTAGDVMDQLFRKEDFKNSLSNMKVYQFEGGVKDTLKKPNLHDAKIDANGRPTPDDMWSTIIP